MTQWDIQHLAETYPMQLLRLMPHMGDEELVYAAEYIGSSYSDKDSDHEEILTYLENLMEHENPLVKEAAELGYASMWSTVDMDRNAYTRR